MADHVRYLGGPDGKNYWPGVPARDLTNGEWEALSESTQEACLAAGLYAPALEGKKRKPKDEVTDVE